MSVNSFRFLSIILFITSFFPDAFYVGDTFKPWSSPSLFILGWAGVSFGYIGWLANPAYFLALFGPVKRRKMFALSSAILSLTFLFHSQILVNAAGHESVIIAYGWGYLLWSSSMFLLYIGEVLNLNKESERRELGIMICLLMFFLEGVVLSSIMKKETTLSKRNDEFERACKLVKQDIYAPVKNLKGVYIPWGTPGRSFERIDGNRFYGSIRGQVISFYVNKENAGIFEEQDNYRYSPYNGIPRYVRLWADKPNERILTDTLEANYSIAYEDLIPLSNSSGIEAYRILVKHIPDNQIVAETAFAMIENEQLACTPIKNGSYSVTKFLSEVLGLSIL